MHSFVDVVLFIGTKYNVIILILIYMYTVCETQIILPAYQFILVLKKYILRTLRFAMAGL